MIPLFWHNMVTVWFMVVANNVMMCIWSTNRIRKVQVPVHWLWRFGRSMWSITIILIHFDETHPNPIFLRDLFFNWIYSTKYRNQCMYITSTRFRRNNIFRQHGFLNIEPLINDSSSHQNQHHHQHYLSSLSLFFFRLLLCSKNNKISLKRGQGKEYILFAITLDETAFSWCI